MGSEDASEISKRTRPHLKLAGTSYRLDETYIKVGKQWKYLYRALDKEGNTIEFMLSAKRDIPAVKRFFKKMMRAGHLGFHSPSVSISTPPTLMPSQFHKRRKFCPRIADFEGQST